MQLKIPLIIVGVVLTAAAVLVMWWPNKVPQWAEEGHILQVLVTGLDIALLLGHPISWLTGVEYIRGVRSVVSLTHSPKDYNSPSMKVSLTELDGVPAKVFRPQPAPARSPAIIYTHGGGWSVIEAGIYDNTCLHMAQEYNVVVISIDYRQAPEHPYPAPFEDSLKATVHVLKNAHVLGLDPDRIAIAGDSAGGNLAAAVSLRLSQEDMADMLPALQFQVLIYPALQMLDLNTHSYTNFSSSGLLSKHFMTQLWLTYLGYPELQEHIEDFKANRHSFELLKDPSHAAYLSHENLPQAMRVPGFEPVRPDVGNKRLAAQIRSKVLDPYFAPLLAGDVSRVPPAYFIIANIDVLRDDALLYVERLKRAGVQTEVDFYPTMSHGFCVIPSVERMTFQHAHQAFDKLGIFVKEIL